MAIAMVACRSENWPQMSDYDVVWPILEPRFAFYKTVLDLYDDQGLAPMDRFGGLAEHALLQALCQKDPVSIDPRLSPTAFAVPWVVDALSDEIRELGPAEPLPVTPEQKSALDAAFVYEVVAADHSLAELWQGLSAFPDLIDMRPEQLARISETFRRDSVLSLHGPVRPGG